MTPELTKELIRICAPKFITDFDTTDRFDIHNLSRQQRIEIEAALIKHFDFQKVIWLCRPTSYTEEGNQVSVNTYKIVGDNQKYTGKIGYVYQILFTPRLYDPQSYINPVKDGCVLTPHIWDPVTFDSKRSITISWHPPHTQSISDPSKISDDDKRITRYLLEKILDNPEAYGSEAVRAGIIRFAAH